MSNPFDQFDSASEPAANPFDQFDTPAPKKSSTLRKAADLPLGFASGALGATRALSDAFGAGNVVSRGLKSAGEGVDSLLTPEAKDAQARQSAILEESKGKGFGAEVKAFGSAFMEAPAQATAQGLGSVVPMLATAAIPGALPARIAAGAMGAGMGVGTAKGAIRDEIEKRELAAGKTAAQAAAAADAAQAYSGPNTDQIALGGALGVADAAFGVAPAAVGMVRRALGKEVAEQGAATVAKDGLKNMGVSALKGAAKEAPVEFAQGGQEQVAANIAAQRAGYEAGTFDGAVAQGGFEALASAGPGAGFGILNRPREAPAASPAANQPTVAPGTPPVTPATQPPAGPSADAEAINQEQAGGLQRTFDPRAGVSPPLSLTPLNTEGGIPYEEPAPKPFGQNFTTPNGEALRTALPERPSVAMGLDPALGGLTAAAALAVDSGASPAAQGFGIRRRTADFTDVTPITAAAGQIETPRRLGDSPVFDVQAREVNTDQTGIAAARRLPFTNPGAPNGPQAQEALTSEPRSEEAPAAGVGDVARPTAEQRARNLAALKQRMQAGRAKPPAADAAGSQPVPQAQGQDAGALKDGWTEFPQGTGTLNVPRAEMPQVKTEHRGAMVNFLNARGVAHEQVEVDPASLKPTQAEFSQTKVQEAADRDTDRSILISSDGHIIDGHHQAIAKLQNGKPVRAIRLNATADELLPLVREFPSSTVDEASNVQNAPQPAAAAQAKTPAGEAPAPASRDAAPAAGVPAAGGDAGVRADGVKQFSPGSFDSWRRQGMARGTVKGWTIFQNPLDNTYRLARKGVKERNQAGGGYVEGEIVAQSFTSMDEAKAWAEQPKPADLSKNQPKIDTSAAPAQETPKTAQVAAQSVPEKARSAEMKKLAADIQKSADNLTKMGEAFSKQSKDGFSRARTTTYNARAGSEAERQKASKKMLSKLVRSALRDGQQVPQEILDAAGSGVDYNDAGKYEPVSAPTAPAAPKQDAGPELLGRNSQPFSEGGKPFKTEADARAAKKLHPAKRVMKVKGGYALADKTPKQIAADAAKAKRLRQFNSGTPGKPMSAHEFVVSKGGMSAAVRSELGVDGNPRVGNRTLFAGQGKPGLTLEQAAMKLKQAGYITDESESAAADIIKRSLNNPQYTPEGFEAVAEAEREAEFQDYLNAAQEPVDENADDFDPFGPSPDFSPAELADAGYDEATAKIKAEVDALIAMAEAQGIDTETLREDAARATADQTEQEYYEQARSAINAAISQSAASRRSDSAGRVGQGQQGEAQRGSGEDRVAPAGEQGGEGLTAPTRADIEAQQARAEQAANSKAAKDKADAAREAKERERADVKRLSEAAADTFVLGGDAMANLTGQTDIFGSAPEVGPASAPQADDLDAMFDDLMGEVAPAPAPPAARAPRAPRPQAAQRPAPRTAGQAAASAAKNTASALNNAIDGLGALFGANSKGRLGSGLSFDENTYQQAKPLFIQAIANLKDAGADIREAMRAVIKMVVDKFGADTATNMKPYIVRFTSDVRDGTITQEDINAASADTNLERDSRQPAAEPAVGDPVPGDTRGAASDAGQDDAQGDGQPGLTRIQADGTPADRKRGDQRVSDRVGQAGIEEFDAGADIGEPSGATGDTGIPPEPIPASAVVSAAEGGIAKQRALYQQRQAESVAVKAGDLANIKATLPYLLEGQQEDVLKAETRFAKEDGYGMLFTNGTGTGKTFSGLGVVKRFAKQGKTNTLIVVPDEKIMSDWIESAKALGLTATQLKDTKDAGSGITVTTYANMGANDALASRNWDLVVADEAHTLMMSADGKMTGYLQNLRAITMHPDGAYQRYVMQNRADIDQLTALATQITNNNKVLNNLDTMDAMLEAVRSENAKLQAQADKLDTKLRAIRDKVREQVDTSQGAKRTRAVFLSATPFAYEKTVDWANGYLFDYNEGREAEGARSRRYNEGSNREQFFMQTFGYSMRYGKLTEPDSKLVDRGLMQRQFNAMLKKRGSLSGRVLDVPADYDRRFVLLNSAIGNEIDNAITWIEENRKAHNERHKDAKRGEEPPNGYDFMQTSLNDLLYGPQGHLLRRYLLEAIKAKEVVPIIREHLAMGRKVVVFHDFKKGGSVNPFKFMPRPEPSEKEVANPLVAASLPAIRAYNKAVAEFDAKFPRLSGGLDLAGLLSPVERFTKEFQGVLLINGDEKKSDLLQRYKTFNDDATGPVVALVQSAKNKGWSGHDTTGKHQRVLFNLGLPTQPTMSIQQEGRIYRTGQVSNAIFRYLNTGTNWERWAFAQTIADRASAAENLGSGELSRALKDAFISGFEESDTYAPGHEGEGTGGKERDKASNNAMSEWDRAKSFYFGTQKKNSRTKAQEGTDYFATPEPIGLKMVQWLKLRGGESALEPSGGHGAIARWIPETASRTVIEPSSALRSRLAMVMNPAEDRILDGQFEDLDVVNKFDGIAMNPPFGTAGRMAIDHLAKAATHLRDGGRIVAIIPTGPAADKRFDQWLYEDSSKSAKPLFDMAGTKLYAGDTLHFKAFGREFSMKLGRIAVSNGVQYAVPEGGKLENGINLTVGGFDRVEPGPRTETFRPTKDMHLVADIKLPQVTFERAGTTVATRIVVIEKQTDSALAPDPKSFDFTGADNIATLFDRMENIDLPERKMTAAQQARADAGAEKQKATPAKDRPTKRQPEPVVDRGDAEIITYTTKAGKELRGIIRTDLTKEQAQKIDPYTWKMQGGFFIREKYLKPAGDAPAFSRGGTQSVNRNVGDAPAAEAQRVQAAIEGKGLIDAARFLTQSANKSRAAVAQKVLDKLERLEKAGVDLKLNIVHRGDMVPADLASSRGYTETGFDEKGRDIAVWLNGADVTGKVGTEEEVLLHELVHAATTGMVFYGNKVPDSLAGRHAKDLEAVTDAIADHISRRFAEADAGKIKLTEFEKDMRAGANNAFRSDDEVLAWALSNADAQAYLDGIPYKSGSMWSNFVQSVRTLLGLTPAMDTALSEVLRVADRMLTEDAPQTGRAAFWHKRGLRMVQQQGRGSLVQRQDRADGANPANPGSRFSRGIPASTAKQITDAIRARWANAPEIVVAANMQDPAVPERVRQEDAKQRSQGASGEPEGFYHGGKVYIVAGALNRPADVVRVLFHEALGHAGLRGVFGESLTPILNQIATMRRADVIARARQYGLVRNNANGDPVVDVETATDAEVWAAMTQSHKSQAAEEVLAFMAQDRPELGFVRRAIAAIRAFLRKNVPGFASMKLTDADIINSFILPARRFVERGPGGGPRGGQNSWMPAFQRAYHGSPHRFDKFTTGAIGAGEGAQVYGYGLYFASKRDVAEHYRVNLSAETRGDTNNWQYQGRDVTMNEHINKAPGRHPEISESDAKNAAFLASEYVSGNRDTPSEDRLQRSDVGRAIQKEMAGLKRTQGQLYEVEIPEDADMLLWDKPLSEMPAKVKDAILYDMGVSGRWQNDTGMRRFIEAPRATDTGQQAYRTLSRLLGSDKAASDALAAAGVKGIKYLDGDSRAGGDGTFNYVVFSDDDVAIQSTMFSRFNAGDAKIPAFDDIRNPKENLSEVGSSLSTSFKIIGKRTVPMESLMGAMSTSAGDAKRAQDLAEKLKQEGSFFERVIVDDAGNVIEGQHRVAALRLLGAKTVPAVVIQDFMRDFDAAAVGKAMTDAQPMNSDSKNRLVGLLAEIYADEKGDIAEIGEYEVPRGFAKAWGAGIEALTKVKTATPMFSRANAGAAGVAGAAIDRARDAANAMAGRNDARAADMPGLSDVQRAMLGKIGSSRTPAADAIKAATDRAGLKIRQGMLDRYASLKELDEQTLGADFLNTSITNSSWVLAKMSSAGGGALNSMMSVGRIKYNAAQKVIEMKGEPDGGLTAVLKKLGPPAEVERFFGWVASNRSNAIVERNQAAIARTAEAKAELKIIKDMQAAPGKTALQVSQLADARKEWENIIAREAPFLDVTERLFTPEEIAAGMTLNTGTTEAGAARRQLYAAAFADFQKYRDDVLAIAEAAGIISEENRAMWRDEFYVPFYRVMDEDAKAGGPGGGKGLSRQEAFKRLKGGKQNLNDLMENTLLNFHHLLSASLKNQAAVQAVKNAEQVGIARKVPESRRDTKKSTFVLEGGQKVFYEVDDPLVFESITTLSDPGLNSTAVQVMSAFKRVFTQLTTVTPQFIIANTFRDLLQAGATSPTSKNIGKNFAQGIKSYQDEKTRAEMLASGGAFSFGHIYGMDAEEVRASLRKTVAGAELISDPSMIPGILRKGWAAWDKVIDTSENISRSATYVQNVEQMGKLRAALEARDVMDFSQHGAWPAIRFMIRVVPFLNARLQGLDKLYRSGLKPSILTAMGKGSDTDKQAAARFATVTGALTVATMALFMANADDEEYQKLEEWQKDTYWFFRIGDNAFFLPKPFEVGAIATLAERTLQQAVDDKATGKLFAERLKEMLMQTFAFNPVPQMFQPMVDIYSNRDAFTGRDIESFGMERLSTGLRARDTTTAPARALSAATRVFGEDTPVSISPVQADHLIKGYLGGVGASAAGILDTMYRAATGQESPDKRFVEYQPIRRFYRDLETPVANTKYSTLFYDGLKEANRVYADVMELQKLGRTDEAQALSTEKRSVLQMRIRLNAQQRILTEINNRLKEVRRSDKDGEWKRREVDRLNTIREQITLRMGKMIEDTRATQ